MFLLHFYRLYVSLAAAASLMFFAAAPVWLALTAAVAVRAAWFLIEWQAGEARIRRAFSRHIDDFRRQYGPYGIRLANKAENDARIRRSLAEVFDSDTEKLKKTVEQLEVMDTLFNAGMRPEGDEYLLHDLKLKYGRLRLEKK